MGHKVHPKGFRLGTVFTWDSRWFADDKQYKVFVLEDEKIRVLMEKRLHAAGIIKVEIERSINKIHVVLHVVRPGMVIGRGGQGLEDLKKILKNVLTKHRKLTPTSDQSATFKLDLRVEPVKEPNLSATFMANQIADQLARRLPHKRVVGYALDKMMGSGARGAKVILAGRIAGAEISRRETYKRGTIPLSTIREPIDFSAIPSLTKSGYIGVKVWICK